MSTGLKMSSLAFECVFYKTKQNAKGGMNFKGLEIQN